jgi:8-oxo-dGTP diphosphatase
VIFDDAGSVLLARRADTGQWEPPGGGLELGEMIETGLRREITEETGLEVTPVALTGVYKHMAKQAICLVFRCALIGGHLRPQKGETTAFRWASITQARDLLPERLAAQVTDAAAATTGPAVRHHDGTHLLPDPAAQALAEVAGRLGISWASAVRMALGDFLVAL